MKRYFFVIVIFFCIVIVNATPILKLEHSTYQPKETLFATISTQGSFLEELKTEKKILEYELNYEKTFPILVNTQKEAEHVERVAK